MMFNIYQQIFCNLDIKLLKDERRRIAIRFGLTKG